MITARRAPSMRSSLPSPAIVFAPQTIRVGALWTKLWPGGYENTAPNVPRFALPSLEV